MPVSTIPLFMSVTERDASTSKDMRLVNCLISGSVNPVTKELTAVVKKRSGLITHYTNNVGSSGVAIFLSPSTGKTISIFASKNIYEGTTLCGTATTAPNSITETIINGVTYTLMSGNGLGWYLPDGASSGLTFTGDTHTNTTIDNVSSLTGLYVGQLISGTGIAANTRIETITAPSTITTTVATTATNSGVTITREAIAKIIDPDFPDGTSDALYVTGSFVALDGYIFIMTIGGRIYNSDLNSVSSWSASNYISANEYTDKGVGLCRAGSMIAAFGSTSCEFYQNTGNPSGSVLSRVSSLTKHVGAHKYANETRSFISGSNPEISAWVTSGLEAYIFDGVSPRKISNPVIQKLISSTGTGVDSITYEGSKVISISETNNGVILWYLIDFGVWVEMTFGSGAIISEDNLGSGFVLLENSSGKVFQLNEESNVYQDNGSAFTMTIQTDPKMINSGKGFFIKKVSLVADNQSSGTTTLETTSDDYANWVTRGTFDMTSTAKDIRRLGYYRRSCAFRLTNSDNTAWRGQSLIVDWEPAVT